MASGASDGGFEALSAPDDWTGVDADAMAELLPAGRHLVGRGQPRRGQPPLPSRPPSPAPRLRYHVGRRLHRAELQVRCGEAGRQAELHARRRLQLHPLLLLRPPPTTASVDKDTHAIEHAGTDSHGLARKVYFDGIFKPGILYMLSDGARYSPGQPSDKLAKTYPKELVLLVSAEMGHGIPGKYGEFKLGVKCIERENQPYFEIRQRLEQTSEMTQEFDQNKPSRKKILLAVPLLPACAMTIMQSEGFEADGILLLRHLPVGKDLHRHIVVQGSNMSFTSFADHFAETDSFESKEQKQLTASIKSMDKHFIGGTLDKVEAADFQAEEDNSQVRATFDWKPYLHGILGTASGG